MNKIKLRVIQDIWKAARTNCSMSADEHKFTLDYMNTHNLKKLNWVQEKKLHRLYLQDVRKQKKNQRGKNNVHKK